MQESQKNAKKRKKRVFFVFLGVKQRPKKRALFGPFWALFTLLNWPKNPTFRKMHEKQGVTGGSKKTSFFVFFCDFLQKRKKIFYRSLKSWMRVGWEWMMLCERVESVQRECSRTQKCCFSAILKRGPKGPSFRILKNLQRKVRERRRLGSKLKRLQSNLSAPFLLSTSPMCGCTSTQTLGSGGWVYGYDTQTRRTSAVRRVQGFVSE